MIGVSYCAPTCVKMLTRIVSSRKKHYLYALNYNK